MTFKREGEFDYALTCPLCERTAGPNDWPTDEKHGYRICPDCLAEDGTKFIPRQATAAEEEWLAKQGCEASTPQEGAERMREKIAAYFDTVAAFGEDSSPASVRARWVANTVRSIPIDPL